MKNDTAFGVVLIDEGGETGKATTFDVGTSAKIIDWYQGSDGILGVTAVGCDRFKVLERATQTDGLNVAEVELLAAEDAATLPAEFEYLKDMLGNVLDDLGRLYEDLPRDPADAVWTSYRFLEVLPIDLRKKQRFLENSDALTRLQFISDSLAAVRGKTN